MGIYNCPSLLETQSGAKKKKNNRLDSVLHSGFIHDVMQWGLTCLNKCMYTYDLNMTLRYIDTWLAVNDMKHEIIEVRRHNECQEIEWSATTITKLNAMTKLIKVCMDPPRGSGQNVVRIKINLKRSWLVQSFTYSKGGRTKADS